MSSPVIYTVGGTVQAGGGIYVPRQADEELLNLCRNRTFAYVLTPRQMGKSSLMVQTARTLEQEGVRTVIIDLTEIGTQATAEEWYLGLLTVVEDHLELDTDPLDWWEEQAHLGFTQRLTRFFKEVVLVEVAEPIVVFVDEIDTTLSLTFSDDFFIAIRYFYTARAQNPDFDRLSFVLIGVATPADLIRDPQRTPFNVGQRVDLTDFTPTEAQPLAAGLAPTPAEAQQVLDEVLQWTGGHPYLTQRLCQALVEQGRGNRAQGTENSLTPTTIAQTVAATFFGPQSEQDNNLQFVRDMLTQRAPDIYQVLTTYKDIRRGRQGIVDEEQSITKSHLKLAGVVKRDPDKTLRVRNAIYATVFDEAWVRQNLPVNWRKRIARLRGALAAGVVITVGMAGLTTLALRERARAESEAANARNAEAIARNAEAIAKRQSEEATKQRKLAEQRQQEAEAAKQQAQQAQQAEAQQRQVAVAAAERAEAEAERAEQALQDEAIARTNAETRRQEAEQATARATAATERAETQRRIAQAQELAAQADAARQSRDSLFPTSILLAVEATQRFLPFGAEVSRESRIGADQALRQYPLLAPQVGRFNHDGIRAVSLSPDGQYLATASTDGTAQVWETSSGRRLATLRHDAEVQAIALSPDSRYIATADNDGIARIWDVQRRSQTALMRYYGGVRAMVLSPDGSRLTIASDDGSVQVLNAHSGSKIVNIHTDAILAAALSADGRYVVTSSLQTPPQVWDIDNKTLLSDLNHQELVFAVALSANGQYATTTSANGQVRVWKASNGREISAFTYDGSIDSLALSPDGRYVTVTSLDGTGQVWDSKTRSISTYSIQNSAFDSIAFSLDGRYVATTSSDDGIGQVWDVFSGFEIASLDHGNSAVSKLVFSPNGRYVATASDDNVGRVWDVESKQEIAQLSHDDSITEITFSPDSQYVATASSDGQARIWNTDIWTKTTLAHDKQVFGVAFSPDSRYIATASYDNTGRVWAVDNGQEVLRFNHDDWVYAVAFSPDGRYVATTSWDKTGRVWAVKDGQEVARLSHYGFVNDVAFSPDGRYIVTASRDNIGRVWEADTMQEVARLTHTDWVNDVAFSPDGRHVITVSNDATGRVWAVQSGTESPLLYHDDFINAVAFSPDGRYVATASQDGTARAWDVNSGVEIARLNHNGPVNAVAFSPDGRTIATASDDGTVQIRYVHTKDLIDQACNRLTRNLDLQEWRRYLGDEPYRRTCEELPDPLDYSPPATPTSTLVQRLMAILPLGRD